MMIKMETLKFGDRLICRKPFKANGHPYLPGGDFDYKKQAIPFKRVQQMFAAGIVVRAGDLSLDDLKALKSYGKSQESAETDQVNANTESDDQGKDADSPDDEEGEEEELEEGDPPAKAQDVEVREVSTGWYDVYADGKKVNDKALRKRQALKLAERYEE